MSSTYQALYPLGPDTASPHQDQQPRNHASHPSHTAQDPQFLNPYNLNNPFSPQLGVKSDSASPAAHTPADSESAISIHYQSSEFSEVGDDPFPGVDFNLLDAGSPSFLGDHILLPLNGNPLADNFGVQPEPAHTQNARRVASHLPLSPDKSPSLVGASPNGQTWGETGVAQGVAFSGLTRTSVSPHELSLAYHASSPAPPLAKLTTSQPTPGTSDSADSSDDGVPPLSTMQSPRVTVSHWDAENVAALNAENAQELGGPAFAPARDTTGRWIADQATGQGGFGPSARSATHVDASINDMAADRALGERNREVGDWLERHSDSGAPDQLQDAPNDGDDNISPDEIPLGHKTKNKPVPGQTYFTETGGELTSEDVELMRQGRNWEDAPVPLSIYKPGPDVYHPDNHQGYQPKTSHAAMVKYQQMFRDTDSVVSRAATWGTTRRFSMPSFDPDGSFVDPEVQVAGNLFKKMSLNRGDGRRPSIFKGLRSLVRKTSINAGKRKGADVDDASSFMTVSSTERKEAQAQAKLAPPPSPKPSWAKKGVPSINTALVGAGSQAAVFGATAHARHGSVSATTMASPLKSPSARNLSVKGRNRLRSKSENLSLTELWKRDGGPPVAIVNTKVNVPEAAPAGGVDEDEEDDDDLNEDMDVKSEPTKSVDDITPTFAGFQQHILKLNPGLNTSNNYLVDRIAHQQVIRYKLLLGLRVKHLQATAVRNCSAGSLCVALGGSAKIWDPKGDQRGVDPVSARYDGSDGDMTPLEGAINPDSFPQDIPMPPTAQLPAEFECQLCFVGKKFEKPSDWTKHVHEDVQPFTCTWDRCKDPKMFKRKADWVRHENEGHRHLEWWTCDVEDCRHKCFRRDNFLHHLVREHKFPEPLHKTKAAIKRAGGIDPTWRKVDECHQDTHELPEREPCRFCGKTFQSWKKLTVHLAKHMEHISLPVLELVAKKELDEDTVISPVQDPPPRTFPAAFSISPDQQLPYGGTSPALHQGPMAYHGLPQQQRGMYPLAPMPRQDFSTGGFFNSGFAQPHPLSGMAPSPATTTHHPHPHTFQGIGPQTAMPNLPVTSAPYMLSQAPPQTVSYMAVAPPPAMPQADLSSPDIEPFPALDLHVMGLGLQDPNGFGGAGVGGAEAGMVGVRGLAAVDLQMPGQHQLHQGPHPHPHQHHQLQGQMHAQMQGQHPQQRQQQQQQQQFVPQGSVSPYGHSPNMPQGGFY